MKSSDWREYAYANGSHPCRAIQWTEDNLAQIMSVLGNDQCYKIHGVLTVPLQKDRCPVWRGHFIAISTDEENPWAGVFTAKVFYDYYIKHELYESVT
jgi:hypothetical protein